MEEVVNKPKLLRKSEFKEILKNYKPDKSVVELLKQRPFVLLIGPTAAGRNTLINILVDTGNYKFVLSHTTRPKRKNDGIWEEDGKEYWFKSEEEVLKGLREGTYLEAALIHDQQVSGMNVDELKLAASTNKIPINEVQIDGAVHIHEYSPDSFFIFLLPPSFDIWIERLNRRGEMSDAEIKNRLESAAREIDHALKAGFYKFIVNDEIHQAAKRVDEMVRNGVDLTEEEQNIGMSHAEQLAIDVQLFLRS